MGMCSFVFGHRKDFSLPCLGSSCVNPIALASRHARRLDRLSGFYSSSTVPGRGVPQGLHQERSIGPDSWALAYSSKTPSFPVVYTETKATKAPSQEQHTLKDISQVRPQATRKPEKREQTSLDSKSGQQRFLQTDLLSLNSSLGKRPSRSKQGPQPPCSS
ncbi:hypothetical protein BDR22DRAFT_68461 [Usnea florida]